MTQERDRKAAEERLREFLEWERDTHLRSGNTTEAYEVNELLNDLTAIALLPLTSEREGIVAWQPIETAPRDGTEFLAATLVRHNKSGIQWWERHVIRVDDETGEIDSEYERGWRLEDYSHWQPLSEPPAISTPDTPNG